MSIYDTAEGARLLLIQQKKGHWNRWGPFLSERAWGTVREDYSVTATPGTTSLTITLVHVPTVGMRTASRAFVIGISFCVLFWLFGTAAIRS